MRFDLLALYGGPDQVMTVTSGIASLIGVLLVFWHKVVNLFLRVIGRKPPLQPTSDQPTAPQVNPAEKSQETPPQAE